MSEIFVPPKIIYVLNGENDNSYPSGFSNEIEANETAECIGASVIEYIRKDTQNTRTQSQCEPIDMNNLRNCISMALNDSLELEIGAGHTITSIDGELLYNRIRGILDAITPLPLKLGE